MGGNKPNAKFSGEARSSTLALGQNLRGNGTKKTLRTLNFRRVQNAQKKASVIGQITVIFDGAGTKIE